MKKIGIFDCDRFTIASKCVNKYDGLRINEIQIYFSEIRPEKCSRSNSSACDWKRDKTAADHTRDVVACEGNKTSKFFAVHESHECDKYLSLFDSPLECSNDNIPHGSRDPSTN